MDGSLDAVLDLTREAHPVDEAFVRRVTGEVRSDMQARRRSRRLLMRPSVLGAAAVLVTATAVGALVRSVGPDPAPEAVLRQASGTTATAQPRPPAAAPGRYADRSPSPLRDEEERPRTFRRGDFEWGYTSDHTAYVLDHSTGLRLETETFTDEFEVGRPSRVALTLANTGDRPIAVSGAEGCTLMVAAHRTSEARERDPSGLPEPPPATAGDGGATRQCVHPDGEDGRFVLQPGQSRTGDARIAVGERGSWSVVGMCRCSYARAEEPGGSAPSPLGSIGPFGVDLPVVPLVPAEDERAGRVLRTPPIRITAR